MIEPLPSGNQFVLKQIGLLCGRERAGFGTVAFEDGDSPFSGVGVVSIDEGYIGPLSICSSPQLTEREPMAFGK